MSTSAVRVWTCSVCGYVHRGVQAPDACPVCGATPDLFEAGKDAAPAAPAATVTQWRCLNCEHIHTGPQPPDSCPVCGAAADRFEPHVPEAGAGVGADTKLRVVIVGAGIAGVSAAEACRRAAPGAAIVLLSKELELPYYRLNLTRYLAGEIPAAQLELKPADWYAANRIEFQRGAELCGLDLPGREVRLRDGARQPFDRLILTAGAHPFVPPFPGGNRENVTVLRTRTDADRILAAAGGGGRCVCIGGGLLGLETAGALARRGADVTLLEGSGWLLPRQLNARAGALLESRLSGIGITLRRQARTQELVGDEQVRGVLLEDGALLPADLVILATGVRPNSYLARLAGLQVNQGVIVDDSLRSSHPEVYAAGDVAEHRGVSYGTWGPAQFQGAMAGMNAVGGVAEFAGVPRSNMLKVLGIDMFSIGRIQIEDASYELIEGERDGNYAGFVCRDSHLVGAILLGDTHLSAAVKAAIERRVDLSATLRTRPDAWQLAASLAAACGGAA